MIASWYLVGLSLTVGLVVYPAFDLVGEAQWAAYHHHHVRRITWAVGPAWLAQALGLVWWLLRDHHRPSATWLVSAMFALAAVVLTVARAIPLHDRLASRFDARVAQQLRLAHGWRTACWLVAAIAATVALVRV